MPTIRKNIIEALGRVAGAADLGVVHGPTGEPKDEIFITLKDKDTGDQLTALFTIEDAVDFIEAYCHCIEVATLARHGEFSQPPKDKHGRWSFRPPKKTH